MDHGFCSAIVIVVPRLYREYRERGSMNQTEEDGYVAKCFSEDCFALSALTTDIPSPSFGSPRVFLPPCRVAYESLHLYPLNDEARSFQPEAVSFVRIVDLAEMFLFRRDP